MSQYHTVKEVQAVKQAKAILDSPEFKREAAKIQWDLITYGVAKHAFVDGKLKHIPVT
jgi:hypothetical protein